MHAFRPLFTAILLLVVGEVDGRMLSATDVSVLNSLYTSLNSAPQLTNWKASGGDPCRENWFGITCSDDSRVTDIKISSLGLSGSLAGFEFHSFTSLISFDISHNYLGDQIPFDLPSNVESLNLAGCGFIGFLPYSISRLTSLRYLNVSGNQLKGEVASSVDFSLLASLTTLDLSFNRFSGDLPQSFRSLRSLHELYLQNNEFTGTLDVLADLPLQRVNVENNLFATTTAPSPPPPPPRRRVSGKDIALDVAMFLLIGSVLVAVFCYARRALQNSSSGSGSGTGAGIGVELQELGLSIKNRTTGAGPEHQEQVLVLLSYVLNF